MTSYPESFNDTVVRTFDEGFPLLMPKWGYVVSAFVLFLIGFFGFFLNLLVILLMFKDRQLWTPLNIILFNLVCSDFSVSVLGNPFTLISALFHRWIFGHTMCVLYGFFMALLGITSITTLTVISFERYMMVTRPLSSRHLSSKGAVLSIVFIWTYSLALTTPPLMGWGNYVNEAANISCSVNWHEQSMNTLTYIMFLFAMGQIVPLAVITFSYVNIIRTLKKNSQRLGRVSRAEAKATAMVFIMIIAFTVAWTPYSLFALMEQFATEGIISPGAGVIPALVAKSSICYDPLIYVGMNTQNSQRLGRVSRAEAKATAMVFIMIIAFTVAWTPYSLFALMEQFATEGIISPGAGVIPALVAKSSICYDPLIYVGMNTQFRQSIKRIFGIHSKGKQSQTEKGFNNTIMSPTHKQSLNNDTTRYISSESTISTVPKKIKDNKRIIFSENMSEINNDNLFHHQRDVELCTINETRTGSDVEKSGETVYEDDSGNSNKKLDIFDGSNRVFTKKSPVLTIIDTERLIFSKKKDNDVGCSNNVYGNDAYEHHLTDTEKNQVYETENEEYQRKKRNIIKHSFSLDLGVPKDNRSRKLSVETKFEAFVEPKGFFKDSIISKFFETESKQDGVKSYLCKYEENDKNDNSL